MAGLGSGLIDQSQNMPVAAVQMADMKVWVRLQSLMLSCCTEPRRRGPAAQTQPAVPAGPAIATWPNINYF